MMSLLSNWAILLCKFNDNDSDPLPMSIYQELFTVAGKGRFGMVDFMTSVSHGAIDIGGTRIFPNIKLPIPRSAYPGAGDNNTVRKRLLDIAKTAAAQDMAGFDHYNVVVCCNVGTDLSGGLNGVICDTAANPQTGIAGLSPALLGQEMLHGYGLQHSRHDGSETDYLDPWDVMSNAGPYMAPHPFLAADSERRYVVGPGLNAANADSMGWLSGLLWTNSTQEYAAIVKLRPLFRDDLPGWAAARVGDVYFEFRTKEAWDAAIPRPCVLAHRLSDTHSYIIDSSVLVSGSGAVQENEEFLPGQSFQLGSPTAVAGMGPWTRVSVMSIEPEVATLSVQVHADHRPVIGPGILLGGVASDGGGVVILNGKVIQIGPRSPEEGLVTAVAQLAAARDVAPQVRIAARRAALVGIMAKAQSGIADIDASHSPNLHFKARPSP